MSAPALALQLRSFARASLQRPVFGLLAVLGVALGVCVVTAVDRAIDASRRNLETSMALLTGPFTHHVAGGVGGIDEQVYVTLRRDLGVRQAMPVVEGSVALLVSGATAADEASSVPARLVGVDITAALAQDALPVPWLGMAAGQGANTLAPGGGARGVVLASTFADRLSVTAGDRVRIDGRDAAVVVQRVIPVTRRQAAAWDGLLLADIATAQEVLGRTGELTRIDLSVDGTDLQRVRDALPPGTELLTAEERSANQLGLTQSFHLNLTALSLLSLLVGGMLIYNTETFLVVRRKRELAILRTMGVTARQTFLAVVIEALAMGVLGTLIGIFVGSLLAEVLMGFIGRTSADFYGAVSSTLPPMAPLQFAKLLTLGLGVSVAAALLPAREAVRGAAVEQLRNHAQMHGGKTDWRRLGAAGALAALAGAVIILLTPRQVTPAFVGLFLLLLGLTAQAPWLAELLFGRPASPERLSLQRLSLRGVALHLHRSAPALAALIVALGTSLGITLMIASFKDAVVTWLDQVLAADFYVAGMQPRTLDLDHVAALRSIPGVGDVSTVRWNSVETGDGYDRIAAYSLNDRARDGFGLLAGDAATFWPRFESSEVVMVTETLAYKRRLEVGDLIRLRTDSGSVDFEIGAIYRDYGSEHGTIAMSNTVFGRHFARRDTVEGVGVYLEEGADRQAAGAALEAWVAGHPHLMLRSRERLIEFSLEVFSRTFAVTEVLRVLAALVAFAGTVNALLALLLDRSTEFSVLRALGARPGEIGRMLIGESCLMGAFAGVCAVPAGLLIGGLLIFVVNVRSFGWTMHPAFPLLPMVSTVLLGTGAAVLAAAWPAWRTRQRLSAGDLVPRQA